MSIQLHVSASRGHHQASFSEYFKGNVQNAMRSHFQQYNLHIPFEDIAKSKHVAVLIFYKKLC